MASAVYNIPSVTAGTWHHIQVAQDTTALSFKNDSKFDFLLYFGGTVAPTFTTSPGGQANAQVTALEYPTVWIQAPGASPGERVLNAVGAFDGNIWYLAQDNTSALAQTGVSSARVQVNIIAYGPYDAVPPSGTSVARQTDVTNQPRLIALPMGAQSWASSRGTLPTVGNSFITAPILISATNKSNGRLEAYFSDFYMAINGATAAVAIDFLLKWVIRDNIGTYLSTIDLLRFALFSSVSAAPNTPFNYHTGFPLNWDVALPANAWDVVLDIGVVASAPGGSGGIDYDYSTTWWLDLFNSTPVASIGNAVLHQAPAASY